MIALSWCSYVNVTWEFSLVIPPTNENVSSPPPGCSGEDNVPEKFIPSKPFLVMTFTTPPIASDP